MRLFIAVTMPKAAFLGFLEPFNGPLGGSMIPVLLQENYANSEKEKIRTSTSVESWKSPGSANLPIGVFDFRSRSRHSGEWCSQEV
jgi:hypothetical protein